MATFSARTRAEAVVMAAQQDIWDVLVDPELMARFTPFLKKITAEGDHWRWEMSGLDVLGLKVAPAFTERMVFAEPDRIQFSHDPPAGAREKAGAEGWYQLAPADGHDLATRLVTELEITLELPLPKAAGRAVRATMRKVIDTMGDRFSQNLLDHLGIEERSA
jgi:carbon monoxide dehydrogenase subunit G